MGLPWHATRDQVIDHSSSLLLTVRHGNICFSNFDTKGNECTQEICVAPNMRHLEH